MKDAGKPATLNTTDARESLPIPAGSTVTVTEIPAVAATATAPAQPARRITEFKPSAPTEWQKFDTSVSANTGTVDTSIAAKRIDSEESRPLLYAALASLVGAGVCLYLRYPTPALMCGGGAVVFFLAWKVSGMPPWFHVIGVAALAGAGFLYLGHEKGEKAAEAKTL